MAGPDLPDEVSPSIDRPGRPGELLLDPEGFKYPKPQLLRRYGKVRASSKVEELTENFQYALDRVPLDKGGFFQGSKIIVDPGLPVLESTITPWFGRSDSPEYMEALRNAKSEYEKGSALLVGSKRRHDLEVERQVSSLGHALRNMEANNLGTTIRMGLASPNIVTSDLDIRDAHMFLSYLMGRNLPPESATLDLSKRVGNRSVKRHAARLGLQTLTEDAPFMLGSNSAEHVRALELAFGTQNQGNILASLGIRMEGDLEGSFFQEQLINKGRPLNPFSQALVTKVMADKERVAQSQRQLERAVQSQPKFSQAAVAYRGALEDFLNEVFNTTGPSGRPGEITLQFHKVDREAIQGIVNKAVSTAFHQKMEPFGKEHLQATKREVRNIVVSVLEEHSAALGKTKIHWQAQNAEMIERLNDIDRGLNEHLLSWAKRQKTFTVPRTATKATLALEGGKKAVVNPATKLRSTGIGPRSLNMTRIEESTQKIMKTLGRSAPKIPMILAVALAAGLVAGGFSRGDSDGST